jgi:hypothetical protein
MSPEHLTMGYSWDQLGSATVVDVSFWRMGVKWSILYRC